MWFDKQISCICTPRKKIGSLNIGGVVIGAILLPLLIIGLITILIISIHDGDIIYTYGAMCILIAILLYDVANYLIKYTNLRRKGHTQKCARRIAFARTIYFSPVA